MIKNTLFRLVTLSLTFSFAGTHYGEIPIVKDDIDLPTYELPDLNVYENAVANFRSATTFDSIVSNLDYDPRIDYQSRNIPEAQGDINIRGGTFEGTGILVGSLTLIDPQTGHYSTELPIAPEMLSCTGVYTGVNNALHGFNSSSGTISYKWNEIRNRGNATIGVGTNDLNFNRIYNSIKKNFSNSSKEAWGVEYEYSDSKSDGTVINGDHDFMRYSARFQLSAPKTQTDLFIGSQDKYFGWPGMYTATRYDNPIEYEDIKTHLYIFNHREKYSTDSHFEISANHREIKNIYSLNGTEIEGDYKGNDLAYQARHKTWVQSFSLAGYHYINENFALNYSSQFTSDSMERSETDYTEYNPLTGEIALSFNKKTGVYDGGQRNWLGSKGLIQGNFTNRRYIKVSVLPEYKQKTSNNDTITVRGGFTLDDSNRDPSKVSPIMDITWNSPASTNLNKSAYISYSETTQVLGYGAIGGSETSGIFMSNHDLRRGTSKNFEVGYMLNSPNWNIKTASYYIQDDDLADWTYYSLGDLYARKANNVDIETFGLEVIGTRYWNNLEAIASYTFLDKKSNYGSGDIDASFYALNYANHRITLGAIWSPSDMFKVRIDNEWRSQENNKIRRGNDQVIYTHVSMSVFPKKQEGLELFLAIDNAWDVYFEDVPGTPGRGMQVSCGSTIKW